MPATHARAAPAEQNLPLRLCEVLEQEYVTIHGYSGVTPNWLLEPGHIDAALVLDLLGTPAQSAFPDAVIAVRATLEPFRAALPPEGAPAENPESSLCDALNAALLSRSLLYDYRLLPPDTQTWQLAEAMARPPEKPRGRREMGHRAATASGAPDTADGSGAAGDKHVLLNRLLLEEIFPPSAIARADTVRLNRVFDHVHASRGPDGIHSALCLSGGGIRSASFALGVLQALARAGILEKFDYLSTVSGGGYIGSWLSTWIHRHPRGLPGVMLELGRHAQAETSDLRRKLRPESGAIRFLRSYSHFLNPKAGLFSADTWTWIGIYLRNLTLNWLVIIPFLLLAILVPRLYSALLYNSEIAQGSVFPLLVWIATFAVVLTLICVTVNRPSVSDTTRTRRGEGTTRGMTRSQLFLERFKRQGWILTVGVGPLLIFAVLFTLAVWRYQGKTPFSLALAVHWLGSTELWKWPIVLPYLGVDHMVVWGELMIFASWLLSAAMLPSRDWPKRCFELLVMLVAGLLTWALVGSLGDYAEDLSPSPDTMIQVERLELFPPHLYAVLAVPLVVTAILLGMTLFIGGVSKFKWIEDEDREWWGRFGAWVLIGVVAWMAVAAITIYGPPLLLASPKLLAGIGGTSGLIAVLLGKSSFTSATGQAVASAQSGKRSVVGMLGLNTLATAAVVFLVIFIAFLSLLTSAVLGQIVHYLWVQPISTNWLVEALRPTQNIGHACGLGSEWPTWFETGVFSNAQVHLEIVCQTPLALIAAPIVALTVLLILASWAINLNKFSLHAAYRIRIVRTFLGASRRNDRRPNPFTGFDPLDNLQMHELQPGLLREADVLNLPRFVETLRQGLLGKGDSDAARWLAQRMCTPEHDLSRVLEGRLRHAEPGTPTLKALQRNLFESLNRVLETARLDQHPEFRAAVQDADRAKYREALQQYVLHGSAIFANRLLLQLAFPDDIRPFDFPPPPPHKLIHVLNLTLNLVRGKRLAWQERKAAPFVVTPMHSGSYYLGYRASRDYGGADGISIGTAAAVSGAAVSPNMGYSSSPVTSLLLTMFNVRLGWWLGNPGLAGNDTYALAEPRFSLRPLLAEAFGMTDDQSPYIYLSDGGHFENMGLFEMVLRRCRLIIATDGGADPDYKFEDLGNAVRKIRIDLGIPIDFARVAIHKRKEGVDDDGRYGAVGRIRYSEIDGSSAPDGVLILLKPAIYGREPRDVLNYAMQKPTFPQEPTLDQFFGESQFESYRQLGEFEAQTVCANGPAPTMDSSWIDDLIGSVRSHLDHEEMAWADDWLKRL